MQKIDVYVVRVSRKTSKTTYSKPCKDCIAELKRYNVTRIFYTTGDYTQGEWECEKVSEIESNHLSWSRRQEKKFNNIL